MRGTVQSVTKDKTFPKKGGGTYVATELVLMTDPSNFNGHEKASERVEKKFFNGSPHKAAIEALSVGDHIDLKMEKQGQYWEVQQVNVLRSNSGGSSSSTPSASPQPTTVSATPIGSETLNLLARIAGSLAAANVVSGAASKQLAKMSFTDLRNQQIILAETLTGLITGELDVSQFVAEMQGDPEAIPSTPE